MKEGSYSQRIDFGDFTKGGKRSQRTEQNPPFQTPPLSEEEREARREEIRQKLAAITPEEQEEQRRQKQAEENRYREVLFAFRIRPLTADEWERLESKPCSNDFNEIIKKLSIEEQLKYGDTPKDIQKALRQRATEYITEYARDRYPSWWEVYDENGKRIWRMSPRHKASLARMRQFESLPHEEKYEILKRIFPDLFTTKHERPEEKFARVIDGFFEVLSAFFRGPEYNDPPAHQPA